MKNESAFPVASPGGSILNQGMSLRDYFAAQSRQGILASFRVHVDIKHEELAREAARHADALMAELEKVK